MLAVFFFLATKKNFDGHTYTHTYKHMKKKSRPVPIKIVYIMKSIEHSFAVVLIRKG
jgi:hypothetical protein